MSPEQWDRALRILFVYLPCAYLAVQAFIPALIWAITGDLPHAR